MTTQFGYSQVIGSVRASIKARKSLEARKGKLASSLDDAKKSFNTLQDAQRLLATVSDDNTEKTLGFITAMVNKVLAEMFKSDIPRIMVTKKLYAGSRPHINVELRDASGNTLDMAIQSGVGLTQVVSFMYSICLIEIRKGRRLIISDERLNGLHKEAKRIIQEIIKIFADGGFQFILVEYSMNDIGKIYNVEKRGDSSLLVSLNKDEKYSDETVFIGSDVDLSILDTSYEE